MRNLDWNFDTGRAKLKRDGDAGTWICRPRTGRPVAFLYLTEDDVDLSVLHFVRHLIVRKRSLDDYSRLIVNRALKEGDDFLDSIVVLPRQWRKRDRMFTVRYLMGARHIIVREGRPPLRWVLPAKINRAWIQNGRVGRGRYKPRVWTGNWRSEFLPTREAAVRMRDRRNVREWSG